MPRLKVISPSSERTEYEFGDVSVSIGREQDNMIVLNDPLVSRYHAVVSLSGDAWWLHDQDSTHGIWASKKKVTKLLLKDRESFSIGSHKFRFTLFGPGGTAAPEVVSSSNIPRQRKNSKQKRGAAAPVASVSHAGGREAETEKTNAQAPVHCVEEDTAGSSTPAEIPADVAAAKAAPVAETGDVVATEAPKPESKEASAANALLVRESISIAPSPPPVSEPTASGLDDSVLTPTLNLRLWLGIGVCLLAGMISFFYPFNAAKAPPAKGSGVVTGPVPHLSQKVLTAHFSPLSSGSAPERGALPESAILTTAQDKLAKPAKSESAASPAQVVAMLPPPPAAAKLPFAEPPMPPKSRSEAVADTTQIESWPGVVRVLFQPSADDLNQQPVLSPDLQHVLHLSKAGGRATNLGDLMLDQKVVREGVQVATAADLRFSADGGKWMAFAADSQGQRALLLPDRSYLVHGQLQAVLGSRDFSVVAHVERQNDEDSLYINGEKVASYVHITTPRISSDGRHWAFVAMKQLGADLTEFAPGERVVTDTWNGPVHAHISELTLSGDGRRIAYVAHGSKGAQALWVDRKLMFEVKPYTGRHLSQLTLAPVGERCAWVVLSKEGGVEFHVDDALPLTAEVVGKGDGTTLFSRTVPTARVLFSGDGRHVAFAALGKSAVIARDGVVIGTYPSVQADSLSFSPDGSQLAYVVLHPLRTADTGTDGVATQPHAAVLQVNGKALQTVPLSVHKLPGIFPVVLGGFAHFQFSSDSQKLAYILTPAGQAENSDPKQELWVNGRKLVLPAGSVEAFQWVNQTTLRLVSRRDNSLWQHNLEYSN